jgi:hypothetical protein
MVNRCWTLCDIVTYIVTPFSFQPNIYLEHGEQGSIDEILKTVYHRNS